MNEGGGEEGQRKRERALGAVATTPQPSVLRLILNAAALAAASPTLLFKLIEGRAAKTQHVRVVAMRWHSSGSEVRLGLPVGRQEKKMQKNAVHAGGGADNGGEKRNVLIVSVLLPMIIDLAHRSKKQRRI